MLPFLCAQALLSPPFERIPFLHQLGSALAEDQHGTDAQRVFDRLLDLGLVSERMDGRIDLPDIYRFGLGIKRRGGVRQSS